MSNEQRSFPWWLIAIAMVGGGLMVLGGVIALVNPAMLVTKGDEITGAVRVYAGYLVARNLAIGGMLLGALFMRARSALSTMLLLAGIVQILDAAIDAAEGRWMLVPGIALLGFAFLFSARRVG